MWANASHCLRATTRKAGELLKKSIVDFFTRCQTTGIPEVMKSQ
jgi:hypothetical protein